MTMTQPQYAALKAAILTVPAEQGIRIQAASIAAPFVHVKKGEGGKKDAAAEAAKATAGGKFRASAPPRLVANNKG